MDEIKKLKASIKKKNTFFFIGICGIGMSALAEYLAHLGYIVSGSDTNISNDIATLLQKKNITIYQENTVDKKILFNSDIFIITNTVSENHPILQIARNQKKEIFYRSQLLGTILAKKEIIGITGSHGKTTTTALITKLFLQAQKSPLAFVGGIMPEFNTNCLLGRSKYAIIEADDAYKSFLDLIPTYSIITNISYEHLETYKNWHDIEETFLQYAHSTKKKGGVIINIDTPFTQSFAKKITHTNVITYGQNSDADYQITDIKCNSQQSQFILYKKTKLIDAFSLNLLGSHNIANATAAIILALEYNISLSDIKNGLKEHQGVKRRFQYLGKTQEGIDVYDDYGHHPIEINATLSVLEIKNSQQVYIFFQPHKYTRTKHLWEDFIKTFMKYKKIITMLYITDVYDVGDPYDPIYNSKNLVDILKEQGLPVLYLPYTGNFDNFFIYQNNTHTPTKNNTNIILTLGAGILNNFAQLLVCSY